MTKDLLQGSQARRLVRQPQGWTLEVECLVRRYGSVYRPALRRIQGMDVILHHLHAVRAERLAEQARRLMDEVQSADAAEQSFEPVNDEWVPSTLLQSEPPPGLSDTDDTKLQQKLAELDRENRNLRARLAQIESMISSDVPSNDAPSDDDDAPIPRRLSAPPPANTQSAADVSPLAYDGTMVLKNGRPDLRRPIPLDPTPDAAAPDAQVPTPAAGRDARDEAGAGLSGDDLAAFQEMAAEAAAESAQAEAGDAEATPAPSYDPNEGADEDDLTP